MKKLWNFIRKHYDVLAYLFFGGLTTVVDFLVSQLCHYVFDLSGSVSTILAWAAAVIFAYLTNKPFVFGSHDWSMKVVAPEFGKFVGSRVASGVLVTVAINITVDLLGWNFTLMKIVTSIANIVLNYIASKLLVFKKNV